MARVIIADGDVLRSRLADYVADLSAHSNKPRFVVALSGGSMPKLLSGLLDKGIDWASWDIFFADERCVPATSDDSNLKACTEQLFDKIKAQKPRIHALDVRSRASLRFYAFVRCPLALTLDPGSGIARPREGRGSLRGASSWELPHLGSSASLHNSRLALSKPSRVNIPGVMQVVKTLYRKGVYSCESELFCFIRFFFSGH